MFKIMMVSALALGGALAATPAHAQYNQSNQYNGRNSVVCTSQNNRYHECALPFRGRAMITRQLSNASCVEGRSWGQRRGVVWVNRGCRARFERVANGARNGMDPRRDPQGNWNGNNNGNWNGDSNYSVTCSSNDNRMTRCNWDGRYGSPRLVERLSDSGCDQGRDWGYDNRDGLWVDHGCRARFANH